MNKIIDGKAVSDKIKDELKSIVDILEKKPKLVVVQVGDDPASNVYIKHKKKAAEYVGIEFEHIKFSENIEEVEIINKIEELNNDANVNGIIVQLPIPQNLNTSNIVNAISYKKDVDGLTEINVGKLINHNVILTSCTPAGIMELLRVYDINVQGKHAVIIGSSNLVGKPLFNLLLHDNATVTICHKYTENLNDITKTADILIVAVGKKDLINKEMIKEGCIIIDVGINKIDDKVYGDVNFDDVYDKVKLITPVPGGVGPMTVAMLLTNVVKSYQDK